MKVKNLVVMLLLSVCAIPSFAQNDNSFKRIILSVSPDAAFDKVVDYLQTTDMFIQSVDKQAGFIQARVFIKDNKFFSTKAGVRRTMNFIIRTTGSKTSVMLNIYSEDYNSSNSSSSYFEDKGILNDASVYGEVLRNLQKAVDE